MEKTNLSKYEHINESVYNLIASNTIVLDVGCWTGSLGVALMKHKNCVMDGIDNNEKALGKAKAYGYTDVYNINLNELTKLSIKPKLYDFIVFADILEHVLYPEQILNYYKSYLKKGGKMIVCLPNIGFLLYRIKLLFGKFEYKHVGVMDKTHVKFYTLRTMKQLFEDSGFRVLKIVKHNEVAPKYFLLHLLKEVASNMFTLQFVFLLETK